MKKNVFTSILFAICFFVNTSSSIAIETNVLLTSTPSVAQIAGTNVVFSAAASGGSGQYKYLFYQMINGKWEVVQPYSSESTWHRYKLLIEN